MFFLEMGVLCNEKPNTQKRMISLNAAWPCYKELLTLLNASTEATELTRRKDDLSVPIDIFQFDRLFGKRLSTNVMITVAAASKGEIDPASAARALAEHDTPAVNKAMRRYHKDGVLERRPFKNMDLYRLSRKHPLHAEIDALLKRVVQKCPDYADAARVEYEGYSERRKKMEEDRKR